MTSKIFTFKIAALSFITSSILLNAQITQPCGQEHVLSNWFSNHSEMRPKYEESVKRIKESIKLNKNSNQDKILSEPITIPVVFHILHLGGSENISDEQIYDQIRILNRDYQKQNEDTTNVVTAFQNNIANVGFKFVLAKIDPDGRCTNGIVRHLTSKTFWNADSIDHFRYTWPPDKYLNFYIVKSINIAPAYTFLPGTGIPDYADAIVCESRLVGSIGTASTANSRVLTHEVGHWFGLPHIWGISNAPGVACGDDFVEDTPDTKGFVSCNINNSKICDPNIEENVQNYMDYSPCKLMFTNGQAAYMKKTIELGLNKRNRLVSESNLKSTGVKEELSCLIKANFMSSYTSICKDESITFYNNSESGDNVNDLSWNIQGGIPSFSKDSIIIVRFPDTGIFEIKLIVSGIQNIDSISKFIRVFDGNNGKKTPQMYSFEDGIIPSDFIRFQDQASDVRWEVLPSIGAENTNHCVFLNHASGTYPDQRAYLETPFYDLSQNNKPRMSFYYAYAKKYSNQADSFRMEYTLDCGKTWNIFLGLHNTQIMASLTGGVTSTAFYPTSAQQWRKLILMNTFESIFKNQASVKFRFLFKSDPKVAGSNNLFIDEINITDESVTSAKEIFDERVVSIYPNPSSSEVYLEMIHFGPKAYPIELGNLTSQHVEVIHPEFISGSKSRYLINKNSHLSPGIYYVKIRTEKQTEIIRKIVILEK
ncbi:MAG: T9SS type A sorting domain-containing protein [Saprospiraceae bacterium]|nr:T9SS type A sorting domain-containing protein [Candidatus Defluviibacterium haderslevense]